MIKTEMLRMLVTVVKYGNLREAAEELSRTQSALSMGLSQLEQTLGGSLFETDRKRELTDLGRFVHGAAADLVHEHDRVIDLISRYANGEAGQLRIAAVPSVAALILPSVLGSFMSQHLDAQIDLRDSDSKNVRSLVATGYADLGIAGEASQDHDLVTTPLFQDTLHVVCRRDGMLPTKGDALKWSDLKAIPLISNGAMSGASSKEAKSVIGRSKLSVRNILSLFAMVEAGQGITILPGLATRSLNENLMAIPLSGSGNTRTISLVSRSGVTTNPLADAFSSHLSEAMPDIVQQHSLKGVNG